MIYNLGRSTPIPKGIDIVVDCTSHNEDKEIAHDLSPFYLGPLKLNGTVSQNFENAWQYSKVYSKFIRKGVIQDSYYAWRDRGYASKQAHRYPMGKGAKPEFCLYNGHHLAYSEARLRFYLPEYIKLVRRTKTFKRLRKEYRAGANIAFRDFDGYNHIKQNMSLYDVFHNTSRPAGHGFCLIAALQNPNINKFFEL